MQSKVILKEIILLPDNTLRTNSDTRNTHWKPLP